MRNNNLFSSLPERWSSELTSLILTSNSLTGTIPVSFGSLTKLQILKIQSNKLNGTLPFEIGSMASLTSLYVHFNELTGSLPSTIGELSSLVDLDIQGNNITSTLPAEMYYMSSLTLLDIRETFLTGTFPHFFCDVGHIVSNIGLADSDLTCFPTCLSNVGSTLNTGNVRAGCPSLPESALCGLVAATNIGDITGHEMWTCNATGYVVGDPCVDWFGFNCVGTILTLDLANIGLTGESSCDP